MTLLENALLLLQSDKSFFFYFIVRYIHSKEIHTLREIIKICNIFYWNILAFRGSFTGVSVVKNPPANAGDRSSVPGLGRSSGEGNSNPLQSSYLENPMDSGAWRATGHGVTKSRT